MDWVVHGYKFMIDFNFGIVDISSGMKRIENSKEAFRNLVLIAEDGVSEYSSVVLTPSHWYVHLFLHSVLIRTAIDPDTQGYYCSKEGCELAGTKQQAKRVGGSIGVKKIEESQSFP